MTLHAAARLPGYRPRPVHGSPRHSRNRTIAGLKPMRHLEPWLPSSCAPRMIIVANCFLLYSKVFDFWETCRLRSFSTRHLQAPKNNLILLCISAAYRRTRKKHASVPATYLRWRSRSIRSTSVCSSCSTQSRKIEQNESGLPSTCHASRPRAYDRPASYLMATGRYPFRSSTKLSSWRPVRPLPSCNTTLGLTKKSIIDFHFLSTFFAGSLCLIHIYTVNQFNQHRTV